MSLTALQNLHFQYTIEVIKDGVVQSTETVDNIMPGEGLNHILNTVLKGGAQYSAWYLGLYEGSYTPTAADTAAAFPAAAIESTSYGTNRVAFVGGAVASGACDNHNSRAEFTMSANKTIYGGFLVSSQPVSSTSGVLLSAVRFASPKVLEAGSILRITAGISLLSA
jgi:hypothetical protein